MWVAALTSVLGFRYNVCVLAYGQTGCGKSYTMLGPHSKEARIPPWGPHSDLGIMPRAAGELFRYLGQWAEAQSSRECGRPAHWEGAWRMAPVCGDHT